MKREHIDSKQPAHWTQDRAKLRRAVARASATRARKRADPLQVDIDKAIWRSGRWAGLDARRKEVRRWRQVFRHYIKLTGGKHSHMVEQLATLIVQQDCLTHRQLNGEPDLEHKITKTGSQITWIMRTLKLVERVEDAQALEDMRAAGLVD